MLDYVVARRSEKAYFPKCQRVTLNKILQKGNLQNNKVIWCIGCFFDHWWLLFPKHPGLLNLMELQKKFYNFKVTEVCCHGYDSSTKGVILKWQQTTILFKCFNPNLTCVKSLFCIITLISKHKSLFYPHLHNSSCSQWRNSPLYRSSTLSAFNNTTAVSQQWQQEIWLIDGKTKCMLNHGALAGKPT